VTPTLTVSGFCERLEATELTVSYLAGETGGTREIAAPYLHRPGLSLVGHFFHHHPERIQVFGETELTFLDAHASGETAAVLERLVTAGVPCCIVTKAMPPTHDLMQSCAKHQVPLLQTTVETGEFMRHAGRVLADLLAPKL
jgi:HPr kinase/phosphorylase